MGMSSIKGGLSKVISALKPEAPKPPPPPPPVEAKKTEPMQFKDGFETETRAKGARGKPELNPTTGPAPQPVGTQGSTVPTNGTTDATYTVGPPQRPPIRHDNGFLQNPNDPNDPNPLPTREPSLGDRLALVEWEAKLRGAQVLRPDLKDGTDAYDHFLHGNGADRTFDYESFVTNDASGQTVLRNATQDTQKAAEAQYAAMIAADPSLAGKPVTFQITSGGISVSESNDRFPYPDSENWNSATVTVTPPTTPGGEPTFSMDMTVHAEDRYNFNPGQADIETGIPDSDNGRFEQTGLGQQYTQTGTVQRQVSWSQGDIENSTSTNPNQSGR